MKLKKECIMLLVIKRWELITKKWKLTLFRKVVLNYAISRRQYASMDTTQLHWCRDQDLVVVAVPGSPPLR